MRNILRTGFAQLILVRFSLDIPDPNGWILLDVNRLADNFVNILKTANISIYLFYNLHSVNDTFLLQYRIAIHSLTGKQLHYVLKVETIEYLLTNSLVEIFEHYKHINNINIHSAEIVFFRGFK